MKIYNKIILAWNELTQRYDEVLYEDSFHYTGQLDLVAWGDDPGCSGSYLNCMIFSNPGEQWACPLEYATWCEGNSSLNGACNNTSNGIPCNIIDNSADCIAPCSWDDGEEGEQTLYSCRPNGTCVQSSSGDWESWANCMAECEEDEPDPPDYLWKCLENGNCEQTVDGTFVTAGQCDAACEPAVYGCTDHNASNWKYDCAGNFVGNPTHDDGCCEYIGCTDCGQCLDPSGYIPEDGPCFTDSYSVCVADVQDEGCYWVDGACNCDPYATEDDGTCSIPVEDDAGQSCGCDGQNPIGVVALTCYYDAPGSIPGTYETEVTVFVCGGEDCSSLGPSFSNERSPNSPPIVNVSIT